MNIPCSWRLQKHRYCLRASTCLQCGQNVFPPRDVCTTCRRRIRAIAVGSRLHRRLHIHTGMAGDGPPSPTDP